jgi:leucine dehydrogenase
VELFETLKQMGYGELHFGYDAKTGMRAIVGLHSTRLGPAIGGCRVREYPTEADAIDDVTRLARGMTYKNALCGIPHGGGKSVIMAPHGFTSRSASDRNAFFQAFGRVVDGLNGRYLTAEDSGTSAEDMNAIRSVTKSVLGVSAELGGSGDPSPFTALGVRRGIEAVANGFLKKDSLKGLHVVVVGVGHVGTYLAKELHAAGAKLTIADVVPERRALVAKELGAAVVDVDGALDVPCDILSLNALGGAITMDIAKRIQCKAVAGAANNQLRTPEAGRALYERGIFYAPDYAINAGGVVNVAEEYRGYSKDRSMTGTLGIYDTILNIIERSKKEQTPPELIADKLAEEIIARGPKA